MNFPALPEGAVGPPLREWVRPVNRSLSLLAAFFSLVGCAIGVLNLFHLAPFRISPLVFFGFYCLLIGYLIFKSTFLRCHLSSGPLA